jgi:hypothetical protein
MKMYFKYIILAFAVFAFVVLLNDDEDQNNSFTGIGVFGAGFVMAFALIENNDVKEKKRIKPKHGHSKYKK